MKSLKEGVEEWLHIIDPKRRKRKFHLVNNWITEHKHARWIALITYIVGCLLNGAGALIDADWSVYLCIAALLIWTIPIMWVAKRWSESA